MTLLELLTYSAAAWYVSYAIVNTSGPFGIFAKARDWRGGLWHGRGKPFYEVEYDPTAPPHPDLPPQSRITKTIPGRHGLLDCIICLSIWVALVLRLIGANVVTDALAIAGVALFLHSYSGWRHNI